MRQGAFETGNYRNAFAALGYSSEEIEKRKEEIFETLFYGSEEERLYHPAGDDMGYMEDTGNHDVRTEGMSYGMMMCVQMNRKEEFDRLWKWAKTYMYLEEGENAGWRCSLPPTAGEMEPESLIMSERQRSCCTPAFIKGKRERRVMPCGTGKISSSGL